MSINDSLALRCKTKRAKTGPNVDGFCCLGFSQDLGAWNAGLPAGQLVLVLVGGMEDRKAPPISEFRGVRQIRTGVIARKDAVDRFVVEFYATLAHLSNAPDEDVDAFAKVTVAAGKPDLQGVDGIVVCDWHHNGRKGFSVLMKRKSMAEFLDICGVVSFASFSSDDVVISAYFLVIPLDKMRAS